MIISAENGKTITEATVEAGRSGEIIRLAAFEGTQLYGDTLPLDANTGHRLRQDRLHGAPAVRDRAWRSPRSIIPALLVLHKIAPALAAGNAVVLKPAPHHPLTALALAACFVDAGLPEGVLSVLTGPGGELGDVLVADSTGSEDLVHRFDRDIGERISRTAGVKKLSLELGASCPVVIMPDADLELASARGGRRLRQRRPGLHLRAAGHRSPGGVAATSSTRWCRRCRPSDRRPGLARHRDGHADLDRAKPNGFSSPSPRPCWRCACAHRGRAGRQHRGRPPWLPASTRRRRSARTSCSARPSRSARQRLGERDRAGQRHALRSGGRDLHLRRRRRGPRDSGGRRRQDPHQLDAALARGLHAVRRISRAAASVRRDRAGRSPR